MTVKELLEQNGDVTSSPLIETAGRIHALFSKADVPYVIIGGMAVIRNRGFRTTHDIDVLTTHKGWQHIREIEQNNFETGDDFAKDKKNKVTVDILFQDDDWDMVFPMPHPEQVAEYDEELKANFMGLLHIIELKTAVFLSKRKKDGIELAAKDLADVVELVKQNKERINEKFIIKLHGGCERSSGRL
jgi:hypothetical protein